MIKNWRLTINMLTNIIGEPPFLDALLMEEMAFRLGKNSRGEKFTRNSILSECEEIPIPLCKKTISGIDVYQCSDPIYKVKFSELHHHSKRFDCDHNAIILHPSERKSLLIASGPFKMRYVAEPVNMIDKIVYFFRGDRMEVNKLLKSKKYIGKKRNIGYGWVKNFEFEETELNLSIVYIEKLTIMTNEEECFLMKTIPQDPDYYFNNARKSYGACKPPYWHPENQMEVFKPC